MSHIIKYSEEIEEHGFCQERPELHTGDKYLHEVDGKQRLRIVRSVHFDKYVWEDVAQWTTVIEEFFAEEYTLTIRYRYSDGRTAAPTFTNPYHEGDTYDVLSPSIPGYKPNKARVTGTMPRWNVEYTVIYVPADNTTIIEDFDTPLGIGQVFINVGDCLE